VRTAPLIRRGRAVSGEIGAYLERLIQTELTPGSRLPTERELAERLDVSRTSVREALRELEQRRLIARSPGRGTTVLPRSDNAQALDGLDAGSAEQDDVAELRMLVEPQIASLAAQRATDTDLVLLEQTLAASHAGLTPTESLELDIRFHLQLAAAARNPLLVSLCGLTNTWVHDVRARSHATRPGRRSSVEWHRTLYDAVVAGDSEAATEAMIDHLSTVARLVEGAAP
jgi:DNA-binding FadR family transcriptional regulator